MSVTINVDDVFPTGIDREGHTSGDGCPCNPWVRFRGYTQEVQHVAIEETWPEQAYDREELIALCVAAVVPQDKWCDRDSSSAQQKIGAAWALLSAGCDFEILRGKHRMDTDDQTIWIEITFRGFNDFEYGEDPSYTETLYLPTRKRLTLNEGRDWY